MTARAWSTNASRSALHRRVAEALERSAEWAGQRARPERRYRRPRLAVDEGERARRERQIVARTRAMLR